MSCFLRVCGKSFNVDKFLSKTKLKPAAIFRKGEPRIKTNPKSRINEKSGININVSKADFNQLDAQSQDAIKFLKKNEKEIKKLVRFKGTDTWELDFAIERREPIFQADRFSPPLIALAGRLGLGICLSQYPCEEDEKV